MGIMAEKGKFYIFDGSGIKWFITPTSDFGVPFCKEHNMPMQDPEYSSQEYFTCYECGGKRVLRSSIEQKRYVAHKMRSSLVAKIDVINYDGELVPVAKAKSKDGTYGITAQIMESKHGKQLVIYAGKKGAEGKVQLFVDTKNGKLAFDHKDLKPSDIFAKVEATFIDGSKMSLEAPTDS